LGLSFAKRIFPDHHTFNPNELAFDGVIVMTEKDAVKCQHFDLKNIWVLAMDVMIEENLTAVILERFMDQKLLDLLVCPVCKGPLLYDKKTGSSFAVLKRSLSPLRMVFQCFWKTKRASFPLKKQKNCELHDHYSSTLRL